MEGLSITVHCTARAFAFKRLVRFQPMMGVHQNNSWSIWFYILCTYSGGKKIEALPHFLSSCQCMRHRSQDRLTLWHPVSGLSQSCLFLSHREVLWFWTEPYHNDLHLGMPTLTVHASGFRCLGVPFPEGYWCKEDTTKTQRHCARLGNAEVNKTWILFLELQLLSLAWMVQVDRGIQCSCRRPCQGKVSKEWTWIRTHWSVYQDCVSMRRCSDQAILKKWATGQSRRCGRFPSPQSLKRYRMSCSPLHTLHGCKHRPHCLHARCSKKRFIFMLLKGLQLKLE